MKNFRYYYYLILSFMCFLMLYHHATSQEYIFALLLFFVPLSICFSYIKKYTIFLFMTVALIYAYINFGISSMTMIILLAFLSVVPLILSFSRPAPVLSPILKKRNNELRFYKQELLNEDRSLNIYKSMIEEKLAKTIQFYLMSKNLTKNVSPTESGKEVCEVMSQRKGVSEIVVIMATQKADKLIIIATSNQQTKSEWKQFFDTNCKEIYKIKDINVINPDLTAEKIQFLNYSTAEDGRFSVKGEDAIVIWPITVDNDFKAGVFLRVKKEMVPTYLDEGELFIPYFSLHARRIMLFMRVEEKSRIDGLTKTYLRRYFMTRLNSEVQRVKRYNTDFYLLMIDIDFFKKVNDTYGHLAGDNVLKTVAQTITENIRPGDIVCRYGGEEFIVLVPMAENTTKITEYAENIRKSIKELKFENNGKRFYISASIGIAKYEKNLSAAATVMRSDTALYEAKQTGRNKVVLYKNVLAK